MIDIIVVSDTHGNNDILKQIPLRYPQAFAYLHCGDLEGNEKAYPKFQIVRGNNDYFCDLKQALIVRAANHNILVLHSEGYYYNREQALVELAKTYDCDIVCYGHTHRKDFKCIDGIYLLNPGSTIYPRGGNNPTYAILHLSDKVEVEFVEV